MSDGGGKKKGTVLIFSQTFVPDPAAVGQHIADVAVEMARRGHRVVVYTSGRGYENPAVRYPRRENLQGVEVRRLGLASFGKRSIFTRLLGTVSFLVQCVFIGVFLPGIRGILFSTSPPLIGLAACVAHWVRRVPIAYWAMDLNPDQLIMMGKIREGSVVARVLEGVNRLILRNASMIVALDRFMGDRLFARGDYRGKTMILPPWSHDEHLQEPAGGGRGGGNPFRVRHGLVGKFVIMYSGNHSPANPLKTLLEAAVALKGEEGLRFLFVGGGLGKKEVEAYIAEHGLGNVVSLPYQPLAELGNSLSAADVHVVSLGEKMVGIIHPCKIYGAMAVGRPVLFLGPVPSHVSDILGEHDIGWQVGHGDVAGVVEVIRGLMGMGEEALTRGMGARAAGVLAEKLSQQRMVGAFCDALEKGLGTMSRG